jgi:hypothetical protein
MNDFAKFELFQKLMRFGFQAIGYILTYGFVAILVLAWTLTEPFFGLGQWIERNEKLKEKNKRTIN